MGGIEMTHKEKTPSKAELDFAIYDRGFQEALDYYCLSEEKAEKILMRTAERKIARPGRWTEPQEKKQDISRSISQDIGELKRVLSENYDVLSDEAGANANTELMPGL